jgi:hypothetical protein
MLVLCLGEIDHLDYTATICLRDLAKGARQSDLDVEVAETPSDLRRIIDTAWAAR